MAERDPVSADFVGKTIAEVDTSACNLWRFRFTDGTAVAIEADTFWTPAGDLPMMQVCDECAD